MKRIVTVLLLMALITITNAQTKIIGIWQLTDMTVGGETVSVRSMHVDFNQNGKLYISGREFGIWKFDKTNNILNTNAEMQLEIIKGDNKIEKLTNDELVLINPNNEIQKFKRTSLPYGKEYKNKVVGEYLFLKIEEAKKTENIGNIIVDFRNNGTLYFQAMFFGTWKYDKKKKTITLSTKEDEFNGLGKIEKMGNEFVFSMQNSSKFFFKRLDREKITKENKASGLIGLWKIEINYSNNITAEEAVEEVVEEAAEEVVEEAVVEITNENSSEETNNYIEVNYLFLKNSNLYSYGQGNGGSSGMWILNKKEKSFSIIGRRIPFSGTNTVIEISENKFVFKDNKGKIYTAVKVEQDAKDYDKLDFKEDEYFEITDNGKSRSAKLEIDISKLPWNDFYTNIEYLKNIKKLKYNSLKPIEQFELFEKTELSTRVKYNQEENIVEIDDIFNGYSGDDPLKLEYGKLDFFDKPMFHPYFIFEKFLSGKIKGEETITTPAGTFICTVIEGYYDWDKKTKLWMINDKPGVYAKIIKSDKKPRGDYEYLSFILKEIIE